jgi:hypothetical protein
MKKIVFVPFFMAMIAFTAGFSFADEEKKVQDNVLKYTQKLSSKSKKNEAVRAGDIYASCQHYLENKFNTSEAISKRASCNGYFFGIGGMLVALQNEKIATKTCLPADISTDNMGKAFLKWAEKSDSDLKMSASEATLLAIREYFPCQ